MQLLWQSKRHFGQSWQPAMGHPQKDAPQVQQVEMFTANHIQPPRTAKKIVASGSGKPAEFSSL